MTKVRVIYLNKRYDWDRIKWPFLKIVFDGAKRYQGCIIIGNRLPIREDKLIDFAPVIKKHFSPENIDILRGLTVVVGKGMFRPGEVTPPKSKTSKLSILCH